MSSVSHGLLTGGQYAAALLLLYVFVIPAALGWVSWKRTALIQGIWFGLIALAMAIWGEHPAGGATLYGVLSATMLVAWWFADDDDRPRRRRRRAAVAARARLRTFGAGLIPPALNPQPNGAR